MVTLVSTDEKSLSTGDVKFNIKGENGLTTEANGEDVTVKIDDATKAKSIMQQIKT